jgi:hypothetical protein
MYNRALVGIACTIDNEHDGYKEMAPMFNSYIL